MLAVKSMDVRDHFKEWCQKVIAGETLVVSRPKNENVYIISEPEYNELIRIRKNAEYIAMLDKSQQELENGEVVVKTMEELWALENE